MNCELIGVSIDSHYSHIAWLRTIKEKIEYKGMKNVEVLFPVVADIKMEVAKKFGMVQPNASDTQAVRAVFMIDPKAIVRAILYYPLSNGRNMQEIKRLLLAMQKSDKDGIATPANWQPGDDVIVPPAGSCGVAKERMETKDPNIYCLDWFMCFKRESKKQEGKKRLLYLLGDALFFLILYRRTTITACKLPRLCGNSNPPLTFLDCEQDI